MPKIAVAGRWEVGWNAPLMEAPQWAFPMRDFAVDEWYMHPITGITHSEEYHINLKERSEFSEIVEEAEGYTRVYVEPGVGENISSFEHPENALYIFGSANFDPTKAYMRPEDKALYIPTIENKGLLWPHQCLVLILYDRMIKGGVWDSKEQ